jgi:hypothetical protein
MKLALFLYCTTICFIILLWQYSKKSDNSINDCNNSRLAFYQVPSSSWFVWTDKYYPEICKEKSPPTNNNNNTNKRKQHGYFLHITDMHVRRTS